MNVLDSELPRNASPLVPDVGAVFLGASPAPPSTRRDVDMRILLYSKEADDFRNRRRQLLESNFRDQNVETISTVDGLACKLREPSEGNQIIILLISDREDLQRILSLQHLFLNVPLIIQVPDSSVETLQMAHRLRPRYLDAGQDALQSVLEVLRKMLARPSPTLPVRP